MELNICGNGFDLHHRLATSYKNYKDFLCSGIPGDCSKQNVVKWFEKNAYLNTTTLERWNDVECSLTLNTDEYIKDYIKKFHPSNQLNPNAPTYNEDLKKFMKNSSEFNEKSSFINQVYAFTSLYFYDWLRSIDFSKAKADLDFSVNDIFINFNYTSTLEKVYSIPKENILYIHGSLNNISHEDVEGDSKLINGSNTTEYRPIFISSELQFGSVNNDSQPIETLLIEKYSKDPLYDQLHKNLIEEITDYLKHSYKDVEKNKDKILSFLSDKKIDKVNIMGHCLLGVDDYYYENILIPLYSHCKWMIFYYDNDSKEIAFKFVKKYNLDAKLKKW